jgi:hypothetical protein
MLFLFHNELDLGFLEDPLSINELEYILNYPQDQIKKIHSLQFAGVDSDGFDQKFDFIINHKN